ncbi:MULTISPECIES: ATP-binding protein [unclassified Streptomyces]|uniref:ATP-binding protein n=1 Tax=unclassified Streptomyces TaxID=2593676 RepID=UPI0005A79B77|nr:ATP-binding protein [Streptomyces sp. NBC_00370]
MRAHRRAPGRAARATYLLPRSDTSARWARHLTGAYLDHGCGEPISADQMDDAKLVVSELVTNATRYGRGSCRLRLSVGNGQVTVEVHDDNPARPVLRVAEPAQTVDTDNASAESGRGIALVCALSNQFVVLRGPGTGKTVQAVLPGC